MRNLIVILGDQLDIHSAAFDGFDRARDAVWMAEAAAESTKVWSSKPRIATFLAAMRHFAAELRARGIDVRYSKLSDADRDAKLGPLLARFVSEAQPESLVIVEPGEFAVREEIRRTARAARVQLDERLDRHFMATHDEFRAHANGRKQLRMEYFYREMRRKHRVLMDGDAPVGGEWNFDSENRKSFGKAGPQGIPAARAFAPDEITRGVFADIEHRFANHPGRLSSFAWPVTRTQALQSLTDFIEHRLASFGDYQDAMWTDEPFLFHARLSAALNLKLLNPREVLHAAEKAYRTGRAPLAAVEGFVRQVLGWREYVRGVYWLHMPEYADRNALCASAPLPEFYWTGATEMRCLSACIGQTLEHGYAHHIQRLMVTGLFGLLLGVEPRRMHEWYLAVYVDAVEWVELPNTLGMSQYADGGVMASKPYVASGRYIDRMSNYCTACRFDPTQRQGDDACPFTTLYWDFLARHEQQLRGNRRMDMQLRNLRSIPADERRSVAAQAAKLRRAFAPRAATRSRA
jgi:deoxyribodipyrimidine photolyase-related protein